MSSSRMSSWPFDTALRACSGLRFAQPLRCVILSLSNVIRSLSNVILSLSNVILSLSNVILSLSNVILSLSKDDRFLHFSVCTMTLVS